MSTTATSTALTRRGSASSGWVAFAIGMVAMCIVFSLLLLPGPTVDALIKEDGPIEWIGAIGLFVGSGLFFASFLAARRRGPEATGLSRLGIWVLLLMAGGLFFAGGEEISWAQRLIGYGEPAEIGKYNAQHEMTLHNLNIFQGTAIDGDRLFRLGYIGLFVLLPMLTWVSRGLRRRLVRLVPIVAPWLASLFLMAWVLAEIARHTFGGAYPTDAIYPMSHSISEALESSVEVMAGIAGYLSWQQMRGRGNGLVGSGDDLAAAGAPADPAR